MDLSLTNNSVEAWNGAFNTSQPSRASLWTVLDGFKREDGHARQKCFDDTQSVVVAGDPMVGNSRRVAVKLRHERLKILCGQYGMMTNRRLYLEQIVSLMHIYVESLDQYLCKCAFSVEIFSGFLTEKIVCLTIC